MANSDRYYIGKAEIGLDNPEAKEKLSGRLRQYLDLRNVSLLIGNGASIPLGAPKINNIGSLKAELEVDPFKLHSADLHKGATTLMTLLLQNVEQPIGVEAVLGILSHLLGDFDALGNKTEIKVNNKIISKENVQALNVLLKKWLFIKCDEMSKSTDDSKLKYHVELFRRFLLRSTSLPRLKTFTTNYDVFIERALDLLGVAYFDGFLGTTQRSLRTESYHYDLYFPGETTEGRVSRVDRVLQLFKLHGSINWRRNKSEALSDVIINPQIAEDNDYSDVMVYPSPLKNTEMHGYPYSEMFRHFASQIHQPQSVLFTVGYSFGDEHINRIIYQALSIPSFELVIVLPNIGAPGKDVDDKDGSEVWRLIDKVTSKRILVITGGEQVASKGYDKGAGTLQGFSTDIMPDIKEMAIEDKVKEETSKALLSIIAAKEKPNGE